MTIKKDEIKISRKNDLFCLDVYSRQVNYPFLTDTISCVCFISMQEYEKSRTTVMKANCIQGQLYVAIC